MYKSEEVAVSYCTAVPSLFSFFGQNALDVAKVVKREGSLLRAFGAIKFCAVNFNTPNFVKIFNIQLLNEPFPNYRNMNYCILIEDLC